MKDELPAANFIEIILLYFGFRNRYQVENNSMLPALRSGEQVIVKKGAKLKAGDIVIAQHPYKRSVEIVKRIEKIEKDGKFFLTGDNADESTDSRTFGAVSIECIKGKVISRLQRKKSV